MLRSGPLKQPLGLDYGAVAQIPSPPWPWGAPVLSFSSTSQLIHIKTTSGCVHKILCALWLYKLPSFASFRSLVFWRHHWPTFLCCCRPAHLVSICNRAEAETPSGVHRDSGGGENDGKVGGGSLFLWGCCSLKPPVSWERAQCCRTLYGGRQSSSAGWPAGSSGVLAPAGQQMGVDAQRSIVVRRLTVLWCVFFLSLSVLLSNPIQPPPDRERHQCCRPPL